MPATTGNDESAAPLTSKVKSTSGADTASTGSGNGTEHPHNQNRTFMAARQSRNIGRSVDPFSIA